MKKWIETMVALIVAFVLMGSVVGCGQAVPDQGEVDMKDTTEEDQAAEEEANNPDEEGAAGGGGSGGDSGGGDEPDGDGDGEENP